MSGVRDGRVVKLSSCKRRLIRRNRYTSPLGKARALKCWAKMKEGNNQRGQEVPKEFLETGRTGRRNALPDILLEQDTSASTADLPARLQRLTTNDPENPQPGPSTSRAEQEAQKPEPEKKDSI